MYAILSAATDFFSPDANMFLPWFLVFYLGTDVLSSVHRSALSQTASKILIDTNTRAEPFVPEVYNEGFTTAIPSSRIL